MKKYSYKILILICIFNFASCRKASKEMLAQKALKQLIYKSDDVAPILKANFQENVLSKLSLALDESQIILLAKQVDNNKSLAKLLNSNPKNIAVWSFLSHSSYSNNVDVIKYFNNMPDNKFTLKTSNGKSEIIDLNNGSVLAEVSDELILVTKLDNNPFLNLEKFAPKTVYKLNSTLYNIDDLGRVYNVKSPLLKLNKNTSNLIDEGQHILSSKFGGVNLGINKSSISVDNFKQLNTDWQSALVNREKISEVNIKALYSDKTGIPDAFNISYYNEKIRVIKHIPNNFKKTHLDVLIKSFKIKVPLTAIDKVINGKHLKGFIANFESHTLSSVELPKSSYLLPDVEQFKQARKLLKDQFELDPETFKRNFKKMNARMQKNDDAIFNLVEKEFRYAEKNMLDALNIEDAVTRNKEVLKWDKLRKNLTKDIVNIQVVKGKPFKKLTPEEMLDRQIKEITNIRVNAKGNLYGFQWHHSEKDGILQAVAMDVHSFGANSHIGGRQIWGGGTQYRK